MQTEMLYDDVIVGTSTYNDLDHELAPVTALSDGDMPGIPRPRQHLLTDEDGRAWGPEDNQDCADRHRQRVRDITNRPDADVRREVLCALLLDSLVPLSVDAQVSDGIVTLMGIVGSERERRRSQRRGPPGRHCDVAVPARRGRTSLRSRDRRAPHRRRDRARPCPARDEIQQSIIWAYRRNASLTKRLLSVDALSSGIVILSGAVTSWREHDDALATAWSAPGVTRVDDRILLAC